MRREAHAGQDRPGLWPNSECQQPFLQVNLISPEETTPDNLGTLRNQAPFPCGRASAAGAKNQDALAIRTGSPAMIACYSGLFTAFFTHDHRGTQELTPGLPRFATSEATAPRQRVHTRTTRPTA